MELTKEQRLKIYKKALFHYRLTEKLPFLSWFFNTSEGFCWYVRKINSYLFLWDLEELYNVMPNYRYVHNMAFWFKPGDKAPRIELLIKAISKCKE